ncbi:MAG: hypothetical protein KAW09_03840, partial [Thermoplasmata archaeon]|nr:hypothetical protein [Thermoplasmata archaeon]
MTPDSASAVLDIDEVNMGDPQELVDFVNWGMSYSPAERYFLVLWGHGLGWRGVVQDVSSSSDYLEPDELTWAFQAIVANNSGKKIDLVGADACRMTTEMNYQLKDYVQFFVGSQKDEPEPGWPYDTILTDLINDTHMGPAELGQVVADRYVESYIDQTGLAVALSVVDASRLDLLGEEIRRFVEQATSALPMFGDEFKDARLSTESYEGNAAYDLYDIFEKVLVKFGDNPAPLRLDNALRSSQNAIISAVSYERNWDNPVASVRTTYAHGMSIWYPLILSNLTYHDLDFSKATRWDDYLLDFIDVSTGGVADPEVDFQLGPWYLLSDEDNNGLIDTVHITVQSPLNATLEIDAHCHFQSPAIDTYTMYLPENTPRHLEITVPEDAFVDLDFYLLNETGILMNNSLHRNIVGKGYTVSGQVRDKDGEPILGATVTIENVVSGDEEIVESTASGFSGIISPFSLNATNITETIKVTAEYNDWSASTDFLMFYPPEEKVVDFVLGPEGSVESDDIWLWMLAALVVLEAALIIVLIIVLWGKGREPVEKSGEELLRELKLE